MISIVYSNTAKATRNSSAEAEQALVWLHAFNEFVDIIKQEYVLDVTKSLSFVDCDYQNMILIVREDAEINWNQVTSYKELLRNLYNTWANKLNIDIIAVYIWVMKLDHPEIKFTRAGRVVLPYRYRQDKTIKAREFLIFNYEYELANNLIDMAELKELDKSLWQGLLNWANHGGHDLSRLIPSGVDRRGRRSTTMNVDPASLDPSDPRDALALKAIRQRITDNDRLKRWRAAKSHQP